MSASQLPQWKPGKRVCRGCGRSGTWIDGEASINLEHYPNEWVCKRCARKRYPDHFPKPQVTRLSLFGDEVRR